MLFSFLVPVYNAEKYLDRCMESLLSQSGADYEIVLVDDGSTDSSGIICDKYANDYPEKVRVIHKENEGSLLTRRRGFREIKGDWVICADSDDYVSNNLLISVVKAIKEFDCDVVMYNYNYVYSDGSVVKSELSLGNNIIFEGKEKEQLYAKRLLSNDINMLWMRAFKRDLIDYDVDYSEIGIKNLCDDAVQILPILTKSKRTIFIDEPFYFYRKGQSSITSDITYSSWLDSKACFIITEKYLDIWNVNDDTRSKFYTNNVEVLSNFLRWVFSRKEDELEKSINEILHIINTHPSFENCISMYDKKYAKTFYMKFSVPKIMKYVKKNNVKGLKKYFLLENKLLNRK